MNIVMHHHFLHIDKIERKLNLRQKVRVRYIKIKLLFIDEVIKST